MPDSSDQRDQIGEFGMLTEAAAETIEQDKPTPDPPPEGLVLAGNMTINEGSMEDQSGCEQRNDRESTAVYDEHGRRQDALLTQVQWDARERSVPYQNFTIKSDTKCGATVDDGCNIGNCCATELIEANDTVTDEASLSESSEDDDKPTGQSMKSQRCAESLKSTWLHDQETECAGQTVHRSTYQHTPRMRNGVSAQAHAANVIRKRSDVATHASESATRGVCGTQHRSTYQHTNQTDTGHSKQIMAIDQDLSDDECCDDKWPSATYGGTEIPLIVESKGQDESGRADKLFGNSCIGFPTERRVADHRRILADNPVHEIQEWINSCSSEFAVAREGSDEDRELAHRVLFTWRDLFVDKVREMPATDLVTHYIPTHVDRHPPNRKVKVPLYSEKEMDFLRKTIPGLIKAGVLAPCRSPWSAKTKLVPKKDPNQLRMVHAFMMINDATIKDAYPIPRMEPIVDRLGRENVRVLFQADAANGYWAVPIALRDAYKTAFPTAKGQLCYLRMGQGLCGAPRTYAQLKEVVMGDVPEPFPEPSLRDAHPSVVCEYYFDDDLGGAPSTRSLAEFLHEHYFPRLAWARLTLSPTKCKFFTDTIRMLGFDKTPEGIRPSADKMRVIQEFPVPENAGEVDRFLHMIPYLSDFIPGRASLASQIRKAVVSETRLEMINGKRRRVTKQLDFDWTEQCQQAFDAVKSAIIDTVITGGDPDKQYHLATDASGVGAGGVLIQLRNSPPGTRLFDVPQDQHAVVKFSSYKFADTETRYTNTEREFLAMLLGLERNRHLLCGAKFPVKVYTDHQAIIHILKSGDTARGRIAQWLYRIGEYDIEYSHVPGTTLRVADGLSRVRTFSENAPTDALTSIDICQIELERDQQGWRDWLEDSDYGEIVEYKLTGKVQSVRNLDARGEKVIKDRARFFRLVEAQNQRFLVFVERNGSVSQCVRRGEVQGVLSKLHGLHGHFAGDMAAQAAIGRFYWPTRFTDIHAYCRSCHACQMLGPLRPSANLTPVLTLQPMDMLGMDFLGPISPPSINGERYILVVVDYCTRYLWGFPLASSKGDKVLVAVNSILEVFGSPRAFYTDNGAQFVGGPFAREMKRREVILINPPPGSPYSVGLAEAQVKMIKKGLQVEIQENPGLITAWAAKVAKVVRNINTRKIKGWKFSPVEVLLGYTPKFKGDALAEELIRGATCATQMRHKGEEQFLKERTFENRLARLDEIRTQVVDRVKHKQDLAIARERVDWRTPGVGDLVLLRRFHLDTQKGRKLEPRWIGPYRISRLTKHGNSAILQVIQTGQLLGRHHLNNLKMYVPRQGDNWQERTVRGMRDEQIWARYPGEEANSDEDEPNEATETYMRSFPNDTILAKTKDPYLELVTDNAARDRDEHNPGYWLRKAANLKYDAVVESVESNL